MLSPNLLKARMVLLNVSAQDLQALEGWSKTTLYRKLNGQSPFTVHEIDCCAKALELSNDDILRIFFNAEIPNRQ